MPLYNMPVKTAIKLNTTFKVYKIALFEAAEIGFFQGFFSVLGLQVLYFCTDLLVPQSFLFFKNRTGQFQLLLHFIQVSVDGLGIHNGQHLAFFHTHAFDGHDFLDPAFPGMPHPHVEWWELVMFGGISTAIALAGLGIAYMAYIKKSISPKGISELLGPAYKLAANGWYADQIYDVLIVRPMYRFSVFMWQFFDQEVIDGTVTKLLVRHGENERAVHTARKANDDGAQVAQTCPQSRELIVHGPSI
jgi:NADH:ubiquinone oxidoreductase subunit 5 (subunit L)/multisubunit Na+/H+ antiporter MnhA subunit